MRPSFFGADPTPLSREPACSAGIIGDPLYELNFVPKGSPAAPIWDSSQWAYSKTFDLSPAAAAASEVLLIFDGVKMAADVALNGAPLGFLNDQFLRYSFPIKSLLRPSGNVLSVTFTTSLDPRNDEGRFMGCSGGACILRSAHARACARACMRMCAHVRALRPPDDLLYAYPAAQSHLLHLVHHVFFIGSNALPTIHVFFYCRLGLGGVREHGDAKRHAHLHERDLEIGLPGAARRGHRH